jgi:ABC-type branched-subunit amino acid transport system ATPase component
VATTPVIEVRDLTKHYGETVGVEGVDLAVEPGEVFGFLGPNGWQDDHHPSAARPDPSHPG